MKAIGIILGFTFGSLLVHAGQTISCGGQQVEECSAKVSDRACASDSDWDCLILQPLTSENGINSDVMEPVGFWEIPTAIRPGLKKAMYEITDRTFPGTDYRAGIDGVYAIYRSSEDHTIIAYALNAYGTGEPDYNEQLIYGFDLLGTRVLEEIVDW